MGDKKVRKVQIWDSYGSVFWHVMAFLSFLLLILGCITFLFAGTRILYGDRWFVWFILAACGLISVSFSIFCMSLFPSWGSLVRRIRLAEARMEGAMSISEINRYEEREDRRGTELKETVTESVGRVGRDLLETKERMANMESGMRGMPQDIKAVVSQAVKDVMVDPARDRRLDNLANDLERMMKKKIDDIGITVHDLQTQLAYQNDVMLRALASMKTSEEPSEDSSRFFSSAPDFKPGDFAGSSKDFAGSSKVDDVDFSPNEAPENHKDTAEEDDIIPTPFNDDTWDDITISDDEDGEPDFDDGDESPESDEAPLPDDYF